MRGADAYNGALFSTVNICPRIPLPRPARRSLRSQSRRLDAKETSEWLAWPRSRMGMRAGMSKRLRERTPAIRWAPGHLGEPIAALTSKPGWHARDPLSVMLDAAH